MSGMILSGQMSVSAPSTFYVSGLHIWSIIESDRKGQVVAIWVTPGWYIRHRNPDGEVTLKPTRGWRLFLHRLLWGFGNGLVDARVKQRGGTWTTWTQP